LPSPGHPSDAEIVRAVRSAMIKAGVFRDPFPEFQRLNPDWTRERWDQAMEGRQIPGIWKNILLGPPGNVMLNPIKWREPGEHDISGISAREAVGRDCHPASLASPATRRSWLRRFATARTCVVATVTASITFRLGGLSLASWNTMERRTKSSRWLRSRLAKFISGQRDVPADVIHRGVSVFEGDNLSG
jgi:hypothetical protein